MHSARAAPLLRRAFTRAHSARAIASESAVPALTDGAHAFPRLQEAWRTVRQLPEVTSARSAGAPALAGAELARARAILEQANADPAAVAVAAHLEALNAHARGKLRAELSARSATVAALRAADSLGTERAPLVSAAAAARAIASLRGPDAGAAALLAADAATAATDAHTRLTAELAGAAAAPDTRAAAARLSAVAALAPAPPKNGPDVGGLARALLAARDNSSAVEQLTALVTRWDASRPASFDYVEALVAGGRARAREAEGMEGESKRKAWAAAEDLMAKALQVAGAVGNELDKAEALLGIAQLYARRGNVVEAEGLFRSVEERFAAPIERDCISVSAAAVYVRAMHSYALFLENCEFAGRKRTREGEVVRAKGEVVRDVFGEILAMKSVAPLWIVDSLLPSLELPLEVVAVQR